MTGAVVNGCVEFVDTVKKRVKSLSCVRSELPHFRLEIKKITSELVILTRELSELGFKTAHGIYVR